jgi:ferredoxin-thioredoxin reductase catalytic subunit
MQLDALERDGEIVLRDGGAENWEWRLAMDRTLLDALIDALTQVSDRYPTWSVPKR